MADYDFKAGETYRIAWNESYYTGYAFGYRNWRDTWLLNYSPFGHTGVDDLITSDGQDNLLENRSTSDGYPYSYPSQDLIDASAGVIESISLIDYTKVEDVNGDDQLDAWYNKTTYQVTADFKIKDNAASGDYFLTWAKQEYNAIHGDPIFNDDFTIGQDSSVSASVRVGAITFPPDRPADYDPDATWDPEAGDWGGVVSVGGGRYQNRIVVLNGQGSIYFGDV